MTRAILLLALAVTNAVSGRQPTVLENELLKMQWDAERGTLVSLVDKPTGRQWLDAATQPLYSIVLVGETEPLQFSNAARTTIRRAQDAVIIEALHKRPAELTVTCRFWPDRKAAQIFGRISVRSASPCRLADVRFPALALRLPFSGSGELDRLLWPECDGSLLSDPSRNSPYRQFHYPGTASLQMLSAFDHAAGLYLAAHDNQAHTKQFYSRRRGKALELGVGHILPQTLVTQWELGHDVALAGLRPVGGLKTITWEAAAGGMVCGLAGGSQDACASTQGPGAPAIVARYTAEDHRRRLENIAHGRRRITACLRKHLVTNYLPAQCCYNLGEYPADKPWSMGPYDAEELQKPLEKSHAR